MIVLDFQQEFEKLKEFYACAKCKSQDVIIPILLKTCRHIFCTKCLIIQGKQHCPECRVLYNAMEIDRGNKFVTSIMETIRNIEKAFPNKPGLDSNKRFVLEYNPTVQSNISEVMGELDKLFNSSEKNNMELDSLITEVDSDAKEGMSHKTGMAESKGKRKSSEISNVAKKFKSLRSNERLSKTDTKSSETMSYIAATDSEESESLKATEIEAYFQNVKLSKVQLKRNPKGETQLHLACKKKQVEVVRQLIEDGMDVNCVDWANWTPLHEAVLSKDETSTQLLLKAGCLVNVPAANYSTPLHQAVAMQHTSLITLLISYGADPNAKDMTGKTPNDFLDTPIQKKPVSLANTSKSLVFNCDASKCGPRAVKLTELQLLEAFTVSNGMEHLIVEGAQLHELFLPDVMAALLKGVPIIQKKDVQRFVESSNLEFLHLIPSILQAAFKKSLRNRLNRLPRLFDGMNIHMPPNVARYKILDFVFSRDQIQGLIEIAGGTILKRAPSESTVEGVSSLPYHCQSSERLRLCAHYIIYDDNSPPLLLYNMKELRHVSAQWIIECIWQFQLTLN